MTRKSVAVAALIAGVATIGLGGCKKAGLGDVSAKPSGPSVPTSVDVSLSPNILKPKSAADFAAAARLVVMRGIPIAMDDSLARFRAVPPKRVADAFEAASTLASVDAWRDLKILPNERFTNIRALATPLGRFVIADVTWPNVSERALVVMCTDQPCASVATLRGSDLNPSGSPVSNAVAIAAGLRIFAQQAEGPRGSEDRVMQRTLSLIDGMKPPGDRALVAASEASLDSNERQLKGWYSQDVNHAHCIETRSPADKIREIQAEGRQATTRDRAAGAVEVEMDLGGWNSEVWTFFRTMASCQAALPRSQAIASKYE